MDKMNCFSSTFLLISVFFLFLISCPIAASGQFAVVSTVPANGAANVDTASTFEMTFSESIDTSITFSYPEGFYVNLILQPDTLLSPPDSITISADLKTIKVYNLHLAAETKYLLLINKAVSTTGHDLTRPHLTTFTTGASLPSATVSGTVASLEDEAAGTAVVLMNAPLFSDESSETESAAIVPLANGNYTVNYVPAGIYWPVAIHGFMINREGEIEPTDSSQIGFYDFEGNGLPDSIIISEGQQITGIDIFMFSLAPVTARHNFAVIQDSARNWANDAALTMLGTQDISPVGKASSWMYAFYSTSQAAARYWVTIGSFFMPMEVEDPLPDTTALPDQWLDSDVIADSALAYGGNDFVAQHDDCAVQAFLGNFEMPLTKFSGKPFEDNNTPLVSRPALTHVFKNLFHSNPTRHRSFFLNSASLNNRQAIWGYFFVSNSTGDELTLMFDALTGRPVQPPQPTPTTARFNLDAANQTAQAWLADAKLVFAGTHQSDLSPTGEAEMWFYIYQSANQDSEQVFFFSNGNFLGQGSIWEPPSNIALPDEWIDSDIAMNSAEAHGGSLYRSTNQNVWVDGGLSRGLLQGQPDRAVWHFRYTSSTSGSIEILIDAVTGEFIQAPQPAATTARFNLDAANQSAQSWAPDAALTWVGTHQSNLNDAGEADTWFYAFYSASLDSGQVFFFSNGTQVGQMGGELPFKQALPSNWLDSDAAIDTAEAYGGSQFRAVNQDVWVGGGVARGSFPGELNRTAWYFQYSSSTSEQLTIYVDAVSGEFIPPWTPTPMNARDRLNEVNQAASAWAADAVLTMVSGAPVDSSGGTNFWTYICYSAAKGEYRNFYAAVAGPISSERLNNARPPSTESLPMSWVDSDVASTVAEANGGSAYRAGNSGVIVGAFISKNLLEYYGRSSKAVWRVMYASSSSPHLILLVDAETGAFIPNSIPILTDARYNLEAADFVAVGFAADARLTYVKNNAGSMDAQGYADAWLFAFYSASKDSFASYQMMSGCLAFVWSFDGGIGSKDELPANWMNSDQVAAISESNGGSQFRDSYSDARLQGSLTLNSGENYNILPTTAVWRMQYWSVSADIDTIVLINAVTGEIIQPITEISDRENQTNAKPDRFALSQNYPNPFNPKTAISYQLPAVSQVDLSIYNLLGQKVATLVSEKQLAGYYKAEWDATGFSDGVYFCRMQAGYPSTSSGQGFVKVIKLALVK